jgi:hypothetical protein
VIEFQLKADKLFILYLHLVLLKQKVIIILMKEVIIRMIYYLVLGKPYLGLLIVQALNNYQTLLLKKAYKTP